VVKNFFSMSSDSTGTDKEICDEIMQNSAFGKSTQKMLDKLLLGSRYKRLRLLLARMILTSTSTLDEGRYGIQ
jgi:hypothetical protein